MLNLIFLPASAPKRQQKSAATLASISTAEASPPFILYVMRAPNNIWQDKSMTAFVTGALAELELESCPSQEKGYSALVVPSRPCIFPVVKHPYKDGQDLMTTTYVEIHVPAKDLVRVLLWALLNRNRGGYLLDLRLVPLNGSPVTDFAKESWFSGTKW